MKAKRAEKRIPKGTLTSLVREDGSSIEVPATFDMEQISELNDTVHAIFELRPIHRQPLILQVLDIDRAEILEILKIKDGTLKSRLSRAREELKKKLNKNESSAAEESTAA